MTFERPTAGGLLAPTATFVTTGTQSCTNNTDTYVDFNGTAEVTSDYVTKTTSTGSVFTLNRAGTYLVTAQAVWASNNVGKREIHVVSAADANVRPGTANTDCSGNPVAVPCLACVIRATAGAAYKVMVSQNSGGALDLEVKAWGVRPRISFVYLGP